MRIHLSLLNCVSLSAGGLGGGGLGGGALAICLLVLTPVLRSQDLTDNIVVVVDASGSMKERMPKSEDSKMEVAKKALLQVLTLAKPNTNVAILVFSASNLRNDLLYPLGPVDPARLNELIPTIKPGSKTPLGKYLKKGADILLEQRAKQDGFGTYRLLVVTDGEASDPKVVRRFLPDVLSRGITIDCIGVNMKSNHALATRVHSYRSADDPESLTEAIREVLAEVGQSGDSSDEAAFEELESIPEELAMSMINALTESFDEPIGTTRPRSESAPVDGGVEPVDPVNPVGGHDHGDVSDDQGGGLWSIMFVVIVVFVVIGGFVKNLGGRRGRR